MKYARVVLFVVACAAGVVTACRMLLGPFSFILSVRTPLNAESFFGLAVLVLLLTAAVRTSLRTTHHEPRTSAAVVFAIAALSVAALGRSLWLYFLSDDFNVVTNAVAWGPEQLRSLLTTDGGGWGFYRPAGFLFLVFESKWAAFDPFLWHISGVALHAVNAGLVFLLSSRLYPSRLAAAFAAALFAVHGTRPEAVSWIASRFDLVAAFFVLVGLLLFLRGYDAGAIAAMVLAMISKEAALVFPLLLIPLLLWDKWKPRRLIPFFAVAGAVFVYRWIVCGGIGGYRGGSGRPLAFTLGALSTAKALLLRLWAVLFFPINWSAGPGLPLAIAGVACIAALIWLAMKTKPPVRLWMPLALLLIAVLPPLHLLLIGADLGNSRVLYLPSIGFALLMGFAADGLKCRARYVVPAAILVFQFAALQHNLSSWEYAAAKTKTACEDVAKYARSSARLAAVGLPPVIRGVPSFANGFRECVDMHRGARVPLDVVLAGHPVPDLKHASPVLTWDSTSERLFSVSSAPPR